MAETNQTTPSNALMIYNYSITYICRKLHFGLFIAHLLFLYSHELVNTFYPSIPVILLANKLILINITKPSMAYLTIILLREVFGVKTSLSQTRV